MPLRAILRSTHYACIALHRVLTQIRQYYSLSKTHHPDHNPSDPQASERFVKISEAYAVLGRPQKREHYDRDMGNTSDGSWSSSNQGSHSNSSTSFGSRPASGLSRRRTQFKGPPPSFYRSGGWENQSGKRKAQAEGSAFARTGEPIDKGFGPFQGTAGSSDVPHFDPQSHHRTQEQQDQRRRRRIAEENVGLADGGSVSFHFLLVTTVITLALLVPTIFVKSRDERRNKGEG